MSSIGKWPLLEGRNGREVRDKIVIYAKLLLLTVSCR